jgi:hypothetical protein
VAGSAVSADSRSSKLVITRPSPLRIIMPASGQAIAASDKPVPFSWADDNGGNSYRLVVAEDSGFSSIIETKNVSVRSAEISMQEKIGKNIFWKAMLLNPDGSIASQTETGSFRVFAQLDPVVPQSPVGGVKIDINENAAIAFKWKNVAHADSYELTLYRVTAGLLNEVKTWTTRDTEFVLNDFQGLSIDNYAWRISARADSGEASYAPGEPVLSYFRIMKAKKLSAPRIIRTFANGILSK